MLPLELASRFGHFASVPMGPADFDAKPMVLLLGQYSVGKDFFHPFFARERLPWHQDRAGTHNRPILGRDARRRPRQSGPGNALAMRHDKPFAGLQGFGNAFLEKLQGAEVSRLPDPRQRDARGHAGRVVGSKQRLGRTTTSPRSCGGSRNGQI